MTKHVLDGGCVVAREITPDDDETFDDFMDRCVDELGDETACEIIWDERSADGIIRKRKPAAKQDGLEFVLSDETPDRMDDIILSSGWQLEEFKLNPIALFSHQSDFIIGTWTNVRVVGKQLRGKLELAPLGTSDRVDEIRKLVEAGILKAASVGFKPIETRPREETDFGSFYVKQKLVETSIVAVPANPNALAIAKSLKISPATLDAVFAKHGARGGIVRRGDRGKHAETPPTRIKTMSSLAQRIADAEQRLNAARDELQKHTELIDDNNVTDADLETNKELKDKIDREAALHQMLKDNEARLGETAQAAQVQAQLPVPVARGGAVQTRPSTVPAKPRQPFTNGKAVDIMDVYTRMCMAKMLAASQRKSEAEAIHLLFGEDHEIRLVQELITKAATVPATTTGAGPSNWAAELVSQRNLGFLPLLQPKAVYPRLAGMGTSVTFGADGKLVVPTRRTTPTIAGSFVGEGNPIPVRMAAFSAVTLLPKKMGVITTWTREIDEHSTPAIQPLLRNCIQEDTSVSLDSVLLDANVDTAIRPAGILYGVAALTATTGGGFNALVGDIKQITAALLTGTNGNLRNPVWLMNPQQLNSIGFTVGPNSGAFPFRDEVRAGSMSGWPIIDSGHVPAGTVIALDAADFVSVGAEAPRFEVSDQATLHMEDTNPAQIGTVGTPGVVAAPTRSMFQTDSLALRLILPVNWTLQRTGTVAWVQGVTW